MSLSPPHQSRPRLGTVLSRKHREGRRSNSTISSVELATRDSFDPANEALESTMPIHHATSSRNRFRRSTDQKEVQILSDSPTSIANAGAENDLDTADMSIEIGRGGNHGHRQIDDSRNDDSLNSSAGLITDYRVAYPSSRRARQKSTKPTSSNDRARKLRQDAQIRLASMASQKENNDPAPQPFRSFRTAEQPNKVKRKMLGELSARAAEMYDGSLVNDDRPSQSGPATRTSRFSRSQRPLPSHIGADAADQNRSYILPDLPNVSQLLSATVPAANPARRHLTAHPAISQTPVGTAHREVDAVPIPDDEKAIFVSLNCLQGQVNELEAAATAFQRSIEHLKTKNFMLEAEKEDLRTENETLQKENQELRAGRGRLEKAFGSDENYPIRRSSSKKGQKTVTAQVNTEILKLLKDQQEEDLFSLTPRVTHKPGEDTARPQTGETTGKAQPTHHFTNTERDAAVSKSKNSKKVMIDENTTKPTNREDRKFAKEPTTSRNMTFLTGDRISRHIFGLRAMIEAERVWDKKVKPNQARHEPTTVRNARDARLIAEQPTVSQPLPPYRSSLKDFGQRIEKDITAATTTNDKAENPDTLKSAKTEDDSEDDLDHEFRPRSRTARRDSNPTATAASNTSRRRRRSNDLEDESMTSALLLPNITTAQPVTRHADPTAAGPDIAAEVAEGRGDTVQLTNAAQHVIHSVSPHDAANCIICSRLTAAKDNNNRDPSRTRKAGTVKVPIPIPISALHPNGIKATADNPDPTLIRPSQPPALALACVLKELNDQHQHLKARLALAQTKHQQTDPRLSRKKRERLRAEVDGHMAHCDRLADMIYRLYDVVEVVQGQGQMRTKTRTRTREGESGEWDWEVMGPEEVEVTVQGLREVAGRLGAGADVDMEMDMDTHTDLDVDLDLDLDLNVDADANTDTDVDVCIGEEAKAGNRDGDKAMAAGARQDEQEIEDEKVEGRRE